MDCTLFAAILKPHLEVTCVWVRKSKPGLKLTPLDLPPCSRISAGLLFCCVWSHYLFLFHLSPSRVPSSVRGRFTRISVGSVQLEPVVSRRIDPACFGPRLKVHSEHFAGRYDPLLVTMEWMDARLPKEPPPLPHRCHLPPPSLPPAPPAAFSPPASCVVNFLFSFFRSG